MSPEKYDADDFAYGGWETVPAIFLKQAIVNPYWGDLVKGHIVHWEFFQKKASDHTWSAAAGFISSFIATSARTDQEAWFSGFVGDDDLASLKGIAKDGPILFPGWIQGWKTKEEAVAYIGALDRSNSKSNLNGVIFHVTNASTLAFASCRLVAHRLEGTVASNAEDGGNTLFEVAGLPHNDQTCAEWVAAEAEKAKAAATPAPADAPAEGEKPADGEAPAEGEGEKPAEADPPAE